MSSLACKTCVPCRGGVPPLKGNELEALHQQLPQWKVVDEHHITRSFTFPDFKQALDFVNRVGALARWAISFVGRGRYERALTGRWTAGSDFEPSGTERRPGLDELAASYGGSVAAAPAAIAVVDSVNLK